MTELDDKLRGEFRQAAEAQNVSLEWAAIERRLRGRIKRRRAARMGSALLVLAGVVLGSAQLLGLFDAPTNPMSKVATQEDNTLSGALSVGVTGSEGSFTYVFDPLTAAEKAEIVVYGTVTRVDPGRWNSPDGNEWTPPTESDLPMIYRTFYVEPLEILKGKPKWGTPVAFMVTGGRADYVDGPVAVGDTVLVFGRDYSDEGGLYGNVVWKKDAYHALQMENSIYVERQGELFALAGGEGNRNKTADLDNIRASLAGLPLPHPTTTLPRLTTTTEATP